MALGEVLFEKNDKRYQNVNVKVLGQGREGEEEWDGTGLGPIGTLRLEVDMRKGVRRSQSGNTIIICRAYGNVGPGTEGAWMYNLQVTRMTPEYMSRLERKREEKRRKKRDRRRRQDLKRKGHIE